MSLLIVEKKHSAIDEKTIGVVCIMGNHYGGHYDPVQMVSEKLDEINRKKNLQVGIHVDGASGGFIAPFQEHFTEEEIAGAGVNRKTAAPWDFRVPNVLSISASGHKFGESVCGTGWVVWRQRKDLAEHVAINVSYLGGNAESYTLNFSRPASGVYVQMYKFLRLGAEGYVQLERNMTNVAEFLRRHLQSMMMPDGKTPRFRILDAAPKACLPVVTAMLNPDAKCGYDDIALQHALSEERW